MTTKRPVGRPPSGLPKRVRRNLNIERDADFNANLADAQRRIAEVRGLPAGSISQTEAVKLAVRFYAEVITINELPKCPRCNDLGLIAVDTPCPECNNNEGEIPF